MIRRPPRSTRTDTLFPYATLFRSTLLPLRTKVCRGISGSSPGQLAAVGRGLRDRRHERLHPERQRVAVVDREVRRHLAGRAGIGARDRKSTRLNSSTNAHLVCRLLLEKKHTSKTKSYL